MTFTEWKNDRDAEIRKQYQEGVSADELAKTYYLNRATVFRILKNGGDSYQRHLDTKIETSTARRAKHSSRGLWTTRRRTPTHLSRTLLVNTVSVPHPVSSIFMKPVSIAEKVGRVPSTLRSEPVYFAFLFEHIDIETLQYNTGTLNSAFRAFLEMHENTKQRLQAVGSSLPASIGFQTITFWGLDTPSLKNCLARVETPFGGYT